MIVEVDTKAIRQKLMVERRKQPEKTRIANENYYDGVLDALIEVEKCQQS